MALKEPFSTASPVIATFSFSDIADGIGFVSFFMMESYDDSAGNTQELTTLPLYSNRIDAVRTGGTTNLDFDSSPFNRTRTVKGTAKFNIGFKATASASNDTIQVRLKKWDGSTETNITAQHTVTVITTEGVLAISMPCTETVIRVGEQLRVELIVIVSSGSIAWGQDPQNRDGGTITPSVQDSITSSRINVPFKNNT